MYPSPTSPFLSLLRHPQGAQCITSAPLLRRRTAALPRLSLSQHRLVVALLHRNIVRGPNDVVDQPVLNCLLGSKVAVAPDVLAHHLLLPPRKLSEQLGVCGGGVLQLIRLDHHVGGVSAGAVHTRRRRHDARVGQRKAAPLLATRQQHGRVSKCLPYTQRVHFRANVPNRVQNRVRLRVKPDRLVHRRLRSNGVDVQVHGLLGVVVVEPQQLADHKLRHRGDQRHADVADATVEEEGGQVRRGLAGGARAHLGGDARVLCDVITHVKRLCPQRLCTWRGDGAEAGVGDAQG
mmetsp:Transcript_27090/g.48288  ORF Transcript_27090/g.48288 Transcript_27090/m.48288 type:complete len:292 (-) Transcript_27090:330-1205(-)